MAGLGAAGGHHRFHGRADHVFDFSAETVAMLERGAYGGALGYAGFSLLGSLLLTGLGLATASLLR